MTSRRFSRVVPSVAGEWTVSVIVALLTVAHLAAQRDAPAPELLARLGAYAAAYADAIRSVVAHEDYSQTATAPRSVTQTRNLKSDVLMVRPAEDGPAVWFRDVYAVDGRAVRNREDRLLRLLEHPSATVLEDARRIAAEGARFNLGRAERTTNFPDLVFEYLRAPAGHVTFTAARDERVEDVAVRVLRFRETGRPTLVRSPLHRDVPASGRLWVLPESGAVVRSELVLGGVDANTTMTVTFAVDSRLPVRVPARITERSRERGEIVDATAIYTDIRVFGVSTTERFRKPPPEPGSLVTAPPMLPGNDRRTKIPNQWCGRKDSNLHPVARTSS